MYFQRTSSFEKWPEEKCSKILEFLDVMAAPPKSFRKEVLFSLNSLFGYNRTCFF